MTHVLNLFLIFLFLAQNVGKVGEMDQKSEPEGMTVSSRDASQIGFQTLYFKSYVRIEDVKNLILRMC